jgi:MHS family alpha-ketoglutarate permease-like MFS transporter
VKPDRPIAFWLALGAIGFALLPWYAVDGGALRLQWIATIASAEHAPAVVQALAYGRWWLLPPGALLALVALAMRRNLHETDEFLASRGLARRESSLKALLQYPREVAIVVGLTMGGTTAFYTYTTYMQKYLKLSVGLTDDQTTTVVAISLIVAILLQPLYGAMSDRIGRKPVLVAFGVLGTVFTYPLLTTLQRTRSPLVATLLICAAWAIVTGYTSVTAVVKAELFPTNVRALGVGLPYALTASIFGGTVDSVALGFKSAGHESWFFWYATACIFVSLLFYLFMPEMKTHSRMEQPV